MPSKSHADLSPEALELVADRFRVLAEPVRLQILQLLDTTQPNVSKHLRVLQEAGLIGRRQAGNNVYCFVTDDTVFELCDVVCTALYTRMSERTRVLGLSARRKR